MDPDVTLDFIRTRIADYDLGDLTSEQYDDIAHDVFDAFADLDAWIARGGFLPMDWRDREERTPAPAWTTG